MAVAHTVRDQMVKNWFTSFYDLISLTTHGPLTFGTLGGVNVEIRKQAGGENFFLFGMQVEEVEALWAAGYHSQAIY